MKNFIHTTADKKPFPRFYKLLNVGEIRETGDFTTTPAGGINYISDRLVGTEVRPWDTFTFRPTSIYQIALDKVSELNLMFINSMFYVGNYARIFL